MKKIVKQKRAWQLKKNAEGLCATCGKEPLFRAGRCKKHYEIILASSRRWILQNKERHLELLRQWRKRNPNYHKEYLKRMKEKEA